MTGQLLINGKDAWVTWNAFLIMDSIDNLLLPASPKAYTENNFRSQNGKQVFIASPRIDERDVQIEFCILKQTRQEFLVAYKNFVEELLNGVVTLKISFLEDSFKLTVASFLSLGYYEKFGKLSVRFNEPNSVPVIFEALATETSSLLLTEEGKTILI
ncbi:hypothetical protein [Dysgonomonas sp. GY617]|uniref:hypothetical protein n=1 Tax=Dysgonomonas sp. GY617 TaxID=2780420 RepID=UPI0018841D25|nr:hypothetical protein [Dysgonomonas sp. GY617]MBF0577742.1 hypothetical protein [Dysgonomonas sp. GY617]